MLQWLANMFVSDARRHRRLLRGARVFRAADMPENTFGKLVGRARPVGKKVLEAPVSRRLCLYYEVTIHALSGRTPFTQLGGEQQGGPFMLEDDSGRALVDPTNAFMSTAIDFTTRSSLKLFSEPAGALLERLGLAGKRVPGADALRFDESMIEIDERIAVFGGGVREPDPDATGEALFRDGRATRLRLTGTEQFPLFISDDPKAL
jgi:hypothetical protein